MGSLHNIFSVCSGRAGADPEKKRVPGIVPVTGADGFGGLDRLQGSRFQEPVPIKKIPDSGDYTLKGHFCTWKAYFCISKVFC